MKQLLLALLLIPSLLFAQEDKQYLANAVHLEDGKVVFSREINAPSFNQAQIFQQISAWGKERYNTEKSRIVYKNENKGELAIVGEDYLIFSSTVLSLDRSLMKYRIIIICEDHKCTLKLTGIRYEYDVAYQKDPEKYDAEEWIVDEYALNKSKTKLNRISGKFRKATIDFAKETFDSATQALGVTPQQKTESTISANANNESGVKQQTEPTPIAQTAPMEGFVSFQADKVPNTILQMLPDNSLKIENMNLSETDVHWKGIGNMLGKSISTISISKNSPVYQSISNNGSYKLSFSKPEESKEQPWIVFECIKQGETAEGERVLLIGEITNVWIK